MFNLGNKNPLKVGSVVLSLVVCLSMLLWTGGAGTAAVNSNSNANAAAVAAVKKTVARVPQGVAKSKIVGTAGARDVTGYFTPLNFKKTDAGKVKVRGLINGVIHKANGTTRTFAVMRTMTVKSINGSPATTARTAAEAAAVCDILHLVLGPLDLDLLGLVVHLDKVVLDIVAVSGAGNLLGNLLCAVAGLLDGGLGGLLNQLIALLNDILDGLNLGL